MKKAVAEISKFLGGNENDGGEKRDDDLKTGGEGEENERDGNGRW